MTPPSSIQRIKELINRTKLAVGTDNDGSYWIDNYRVRQLCTAIESLLDERDRHVEALKLICQHEEIAGWDQNPTATLYGIAKQALLSPESGKEEA